MAFHHRSQSEQYQPQTSQQPQTIESIIREHTDSQQSLDQLFNPTTPSVPLRSRNLPRSFFDPGLGAADDNTTASSNGASGNRFHSRSISYGHQPQQAQPRALAQGGTNFHARTNSTLAPMSDYNSNQSSYECLNSSSTGLNNTNTTHDQRVTPMNTDSMPVSQQVEYAPAADWYSPATSLEELRSPTSADFHYQQLTTTTTTPHVQSTGPNLAPTTTTTTTPQSPLMQPSVPLRQNHLPGMQPTGPNQPYQTPQNRRPQTGATTTNNNNNYDQAHNGTSFNCSNAHTFTTNNLHSRSMSFDQNCLSESHQVSNQRDFHTRTGSILAPMPAASLSSDPNSSPLNQRPRCETSREFVNYSGSINQSATGWSSSGCSSDDMTSTGGNFWASRPQPVNDHHHHHHNHNHLHNHQAHQALPNQHYHYHQPMQTRPPVGVVNGRLFESGLNSATCPANSIQQPAFRHYGAQVFHGGM